MTDQLLSKFIHSLADRYFVQGGNIVISYGLDIQNSCELSKYNMTRSGTAICSEIEVWKPVLETLCITGNWQFVIFQLGDDPDVEKLRVHKNHDAYIITSDHEEQEDVIKDVWLQVRALSKSWDWNPRANFVVFAMRVLMKENDSKTLVEGIFTKLWKLKVVNIIVALKSFKENPGNSLGAQLDLFTWFPYHPPGRCGKVVEGVMIDRWIGDSSEEGHFFYNTSLYPQKIPRYLHGCTITTSAFVYEPLVGLKKYMENPRTVLYDEGIEVKLLELMTRSVNMSIEFTEPPKDGWKWGFQEDNGSWTGITGEVMRSDTDIAMDNWWYRCHIIKEIECLYPHTYDKVRWYVPCAKPYPRWMSITRVFKGSLWLGFVTAYVIAAIIMHLIVKFSYQVTPTNMQNPNYVGIVKCLLNFWAVILEDSANTPPHIMSIRALYLPWVFYCWAVNTIYQTYLTSFLTDPGRQHQISSEHEIFTSGIGFGIPPTLISIVPSLSDPKYRNRAHCDELDECERRMAFHGDLTVLFSQYHLDYVTAAKYMGSDGKPLVCKFDEVLCFQPVSFPVLKGFVTLHHFTFIILHALQAGLLSQWWKSIQYIATLHSAKDFEEVNSEYVKLTLEHLQSAFYFLFLGYTICLFIFIGENLHGRKVFSYFGSNKNKDKQKKQVKIRRIY
ncbi:hypothetical protein L9F63_010916 [Diploptera punctata]|uniref:Ionotropic glutamate receptor C-terminal domain-containing protein n=1 Tax=Diploptera punctata TaxID=6984 RepID=A0AAD8EQI8_DIPPU|nr:hypothetical protein L9F63_010916 [Diploptera punctata]